MVERVQAKTVLVAGNGFWPGGLAVALRNLIGLLELNGYGVKVLLPYGIDLSHADIPRANIVGAAFCAQIHNRVFSRVLKLFHCLTGWIFYFACVPRVNHDVLVVYHADSDAIWARYSFRPSVCFFHRVCQNKSSAGFMNRLYRLSLRCGLRRVSKFVAVSQEAAATNGHANGLPQVPVVIPNLMDVDGIISKAGPASLCSADSIKRIVCVSRIEEGKGILRLLKACARLVKEGRSGFRLSIIGDGWPSEVETCKSYVEQSGLASCVEFLGFMANPYPVVRNSDLLVCPSHAEGFGLTLVEALILHVPVLSTDCGGPRFVLRDGRWGCLVPNTDEGLYCGLLEYLDDPSSCLPKDGFDAIEKEIRANDQVTRKRLLELFDELSGRGCV